MTTDSDLLNKSFSSEDLAEKNNNEKEEEEEKKTDEKWTRKQGLGNVRKLNFSLIIFIIILNAALR